MKSINKIILCSLLIFFILNIGCKNNKSDNIISENQNNIFIKNQEEFDTNGFYYGNTITEIKNKLGEPKNIKINDLKNVHIENQIDKIYELYYDGLYIKIYKNSSDQIELIKQITISSEKYKVKWDLNVGTPRNNILKVLGKPNCESKNILYYIGEEVGPIGFQFYTNNDKIEKINWNRMPD